MSIRGVRVNLITELRKELPVRSYTFLHLTILAQTHSPRQFPRLVMDSDSDIGDVIGADILDRRGAAILACRQPRKRKRDELPKKSLDQCGPPCILAVVSSHDGRWETQLVGSATSGDNDRLHKYLENLLVGWLG